MHVEDSISTSPNLSGKLMSDSSLAAYLVEFVKDSQDQHAETLVPYINVVLFLVFLSLWMEVRVNQGAWPVGIL